MVVGPHGTHWIRTLLNRTSLIGALLAVATGLVMLHFTMGTKVRYASYNWLFALRPTVAVTNALVIYLDEQSHADLGQSQNAAWDRSIHARLLNRLTAAGARAVVFDIVFLDTGQELTPADRALAGAARTNGRVVLGANPRRDDAQLEPAVDPPFDLLRDAVEDRWGLVEMRPERDQVMRRHPPSYPPFKPSLSWATATFLRAPITQQSSEAALERAAREERWLNYYGPAYALPHCSYSAALDPARVPASAIRNRVVFVGASTLTRYSGDRKDAYLTPFSNYATRDEELFIAGVEIQATAALNLIRGDWLRRLPDSVENGIVIGLGLLAGLGFVGLRPKAATLAFLLMELGITATALTGFMEFRLWGNWLIWFDQTFVAWFYAIAANSLRLYVQNQLLEQTVTSYVGRKLARKYVRHATADFLKPGARKQELTIFFSDIAGFTTISEGMDSSSLAEHMNRYFEGAVGQCIHATDGTVVKYIGDAIFAFWNAPDPQPDHAERACEAALLFRERPREEMNGYPMITRIGLHTGTADVGNFGSSERVDYTALGENINLASRMEGLNKYLGTQTLVTGETYQRVRDKFAFRPMGRFVLKGFERVVEVHELTGRLQQAQETRPRDEAFASALADFQAGRFEDARGGFERVLRLASDDGPSRFFLRQIAETQNTAPNPEWKGIVELLEK